MSKGTFYKLGRFEIIEKKNNEIWWETHAGLGRFRSGKCFIRSCVGDYRSSYSYVSRTGIASHLLPGTLLFALDS